MTTVCAIGVDASRKDVAPHRVMSTTRPRKRYDSVELKPLASAENDEDEEEHKSKTDQWLNYALHKLHALLWIIIGGALAGWTQLFNVIVDGHPPAAPERQLNR